MIGSGDTDGLIYPWGELVVRPLGVKHILYLTIFQGLGSFVLAGAINGVIAYFMYDGKTDIPLWKFPEVFCGDIIVTALIEGILTWLIAGSLVLTDIRTGKITSLVKESQRGKKYVMTHRNLLSRPGSFSAWARLFIFNLVRSLIFTAAIVVVFALPMVIVLSAVIESTDIKLAHWGAVWIKALYGGIMDLICCPIVAYCALTTTAASGNGGGKQLNAEEMDERGADEEADLQEQETCTHQSNTGLVDNAMDEESRP
eukprot:Nk52_evm58s2657 gene=Nk52_evmTU58s2657